MAIFAEVTYPSLEPSTIALMVQNKDDTGPVDAKEFERRIAVARELHQKRKAIWTNIGRELTYKALWRQVGGTKELHGLDASGPRKFIAQKLKDTFSADEVPNEKMVPSILAALGVPATSWGYSTGTSQSERAGEAWLVDIDPSVV